MFNLKSVYFFAVILLVLSIFFISQVNQIKNDVSNIKELSPADEIIIIIETVNEYWQNFRPPLQRASWDESTYHIGNIEAYKITQNIDQLNYTLTWANHNNWMGATSDNKSEWRYSHGTSPQYVLFADWQVCFQAYIDLYHLFNSKNDYKIDRAIEVMNYQVSTNVSDYWWWADGLFMGMPVMTRMYHLTQEQIYLDKLVEYFNYTVSILYDNQTGLFFRDESFVYPTHTTQSGGKDFWSRGNGWVFAGLTRVLSDLSPEYLEYDFFMDYYLQMAKTLVTIQQEEGYWSQSLLDINHTPGYETSGTAFFTYGLLWGINHDILTEDEFIFTAKKGWEYLSQIAVQESGLVGYVQPVSNRATTEQIVDSSTTRQFGVGAFLLAATQKYIFLERQ